MTFNTQLATEIAHEDTDRDSARFFAGRNSEIQHFQRAVNAASRSKQAIFKIFQGAPGCGKTSLANHLSEIIDESVLFISAIRHFQMGSLELLLKQIYSEARNREGQTAKNLAGWAIATTERIFGSSLVQKTDNAINQQNLKNSKVVIHIDEAQSLPREALESLKELHMGGLDDIHHVPCVVLMTGLATTREFIASHKGLSRPAEDSTVNMGELSPQECAKSTLDMLEELRPLGANSKAKEHLAGESGEWSFGWPKHLHSVQKAICEQLLETEGHLPSLDYALIKQRCDELRGRYYNDRMELIPTSGSNPDTIRAIIAEVYKQEPPHSKDHLTLLCQEVINRTAIREKSFTDCEETAEALVEKGIVEKRDGKWTLPIPSMSSWAEQ